jgi:hypothetical protein
MQQVALVPGESPRQIPSGEMVAAPLGVALPLEGAILEPLPCCTSSQGENPVQVLDERRRRLRASRLLTVNFRQPRVLVIHWFRL